MTETLTCAYCEARLRTKHRQGADKRICHACTDRQGNWVEADTDSPHTALKAADDGSVDSLFEGEARTLDVDIEMGELHGDFDDDDTPATTVDEWLGGLDE
jgi:hypothetical protein